MESFKEAFNSKFTIMDVIKLVAILAAMVGIYYEIDYRLTSLEKDLESQERRCEIRNNRHIKTFDKITEIKVKP